MDVFEQLRAMVRRRGEAEHDTGPDAWPVVLADIDLMRRALAAEGEAARGALLDALEVPALASDAAQTLAILPPEPSTCDALAALAAGRRRVAPDAAHALACLAPDRALSLAAQLGHRTAAARRLVLASGDASCAETLEPLLAIAPVPARSRARWKTALKRADAAHAEAYFRDRLLHPRLAERREARRAQLGRPSPPPPSTQTHRPPGPTTRDAEPHPRALVGIDRAALRRWVNALPRFRVVRATPLMAAGDADRFELVVTPASAARLGLEAGPRERAGVRFFVDVAADRVTLSIHDPSWALTEAAFERARALDAALPDDLEVVARVEDPLRLTPTRYPALFDLDDQTR